ncbi:MAG: hypothetical protein FWC67_02470 [Defluviitaleaceae bacterium]|nr:hypothetical protein [Defluviitaleaceae bacterium]
MKKILGLVILLVVLAGCCRDSDYDERITPLLQQLEEFENSRDLSGIVVRVEPEIISLSDMPDFMRIRITNYSRRAFHGGRHHTIEYYSNGTWELIGTYHQILFAGDSVIITPGRTFGMNSILISGLYHPLNVGKYRLVYGDWQEYWYTIFFLIE